MIEGGAERRHEAGADLAVDEPMPDPASVARGVYAGDDFAEPKVELVTSPFAQGKRQKVEGR